MLTIDAPHFNAGLVVAGDVVVEAAPILRYMLDWPLERVRGYCASKGWSVLMTPMESLGAQGAEGISVNIIREARRVGIVGSRDFPELERVRQLVGLLHPEAVIVSGGANGVDATAVEAAVRRGMAAVDMIPSGQEAAVWIRAAFARNGYIAFCSDVVVAFWTGRSKGTADTIRKALKLGKCVVVLPGKAPEVWELVP